MSRIPECFQSRDNWSSLVLRPVCLFAIAKRILCRMPRSRSSFRRLVYVCERRFAVCLPPSSAPSLPLCLTSNWSCWGSEELQAPRRTEGRERAAKHRWKEAVARVQNAWLLLLLLRTDSSSAVRGRCLTSSFAANRPMPFPFARKPRE